MKYRQKRLNYGENALTNIIKKDIYMYRRFFETSMK